MEIFAVMLVVSLLIAIVLWWEKTAWLFR